MFYLIRDLNCDLDARDAWMILETKAGTVTGGVYQDMQTQWWHSFDSIIHLTTVEPDTFPDTIANLIADEPYQIAYSFPSLPISKHLPNVTCISDFIAQYPEAFI
jgi:hypothetical protein